jgi:peptidoglycan/LPS O-acetylase OafA/YrhL
MVSEPIAAIAVSSAAPVAESLDQVAARVRRHLPVLDGLRGIAILLVVVHNVGHWQGPLPSVFAKLVYFLHAPGWIGVQLFFVLSGFLITGILLDSRGREGALRTFWLRRVLRIFPLYYAVVFVGTLVLPALGVFSPKVLDAVERTRVFYWTYLSNWTDLKTGGIPFFPHFWSLAVEEQFYLVWPLAVLTLERRTLLRTAIALGVVALLVRAGLRFAGMAPGAAYEFTVARMDSLTFGAAGAIVVRDRALLERVAPRLKKTILVTAGAVLAIWPLTRGFNVENLFVQIVGFAVLTVLFTALILDVVIRPQSRLALRLSAPWLRWFGKYSYAIYVFHFPIGYFLAPRFVPTIDSLPIGRSLAALAAFELTVLVLSVGAALVSWNVLERWALALKDKVAVRTSA